MVYVFLADGFEEVEALAPVDMLRRGGVEVTTVGVGKKSLKGRSDITVNADIVTDDFELKDVEGVILPGGMPGTLNLEESEVVNSALEYAYENDLLIGAICAAPSILGHKGYLKGKSATCYPGFEDTFDGGKYTGDSVTVCQNIITGKGAGVAIDFGLALLQYLKGEETMKKVYDSIQCPD
ncbi:MAG: DJ-1 family glyoxalase III [Ruminococcus sp.]